MQWTGLGTSRGIEGGFRHDRGTPDASRHGQLMPSGIAEELLVPSGIVDGPALLGYSLEDRKISQMSSDSVK